MDDRELETLFAAAPGEPPPATFSATQVVAASKRAQARRRSAIAVTCSCLVLAFGGFGAFVTIANLRVPGPTAMSSAGAGRVSAQSGVAEQPLGIPERPPSAGDKQGFPPQSPMQGGDETGKDGPRVESASGCDKVDRELATALAGELPGTVSVDGASPSHLCPTDSRSAGFPVDGGFVSVTLAPPGMALKLADQPTGTKVVEQPAVSGGTIWLVSTPSPGSTVPPLADDVDRIARTVATQF
jgi:hypothetical protein